MLALVPAGGAGAQLLGPGIRCSGVEITIDPAAGAPSAIPSGTPCWRPDGSSAWLLSVDLEIAVVRPIRSPPTNGEPGAERLAPARSLEDLARLATLEEPSGGTVLWPLAVVNGGFFVHREEGAATASSFVGLRLDPGRQGPALAAPSSFADDLEGIDAGALCRMARRSEIRFSDTSPRAVAIGRQTLASVPTSAPRAPGMALGGGGRLLPGLASRRDTPPCGDGPGQPDPDWDRARPRTAAGIDGDGGLLLLVSVQPLTIAELAEVLSDLGAREALALDGGGSSQLWVHPSTGPAHRGGDRPVLTALAVYSPVMGPRRP